MEVTFIKPNLLTDINHRYPSIVTVALAVKQREMNIEYLGSMELKDLQKAFNGNYLYLKLDFTRAGEAGLDGKTLQEFNGCTGSGNLAITDEMTVAQAENYILSVLRLLPPIA